MKTLKFAYVFRKKKESLCEQNADIHNENYSILFKKKSSEKK